MSWIFPEVIDLDDVTESDAGPIERATRAELQRLGARAAGSALAASIVDLARRQDVAETPGSAAVLAKELRAGLVELAKTFPPTAEDDELDELRRRRGTA